jgi:hypothetical protein
MNGNFLRQFIDAPLGNEVEAGRNYALDSQPWFFRGLNNLFLMS